MTRTASSCFTGRFRMALPMNCPFENGRTCGRSSSDENGLLCPGYGSFCCKTTTPLVVSGIVSISDAERDFRYTLYMCSNSISAAGFAHSGLRVLAEPTGSLSRGSNHRKPCRIFKKSKISPSGSTWVREGMRSIPWPTLLTSCWAPSKQGMKREKQFTSDVAHELRTPISVVLMQCEELLNGGHLDEERHKEVGSDLPKGEVHV